MTSSPSGQPPARRAIGPTRGRDGSITPTMTPSPIGRGRPDGGRASMACGPRAGGHSLGLTQLLGIAAASLGVMALSVGALVRPAAGWATAVLTLARSGPAGVAGRHPNTVEWPGQGMAILFGWAVLLLVGAVLVSKRRDG